MTSRELRKVVHFPESQKPAPIVPKRLIAGVSERIDCFGEVVVPLNEGEVEAAVRALFPAARVARMDHDTTRRKGDIVSIKGRLNRDNRRFEAQPNHDITHGLPRPVNLEVARRLEAVVRDNGATPATFAILDGELYVGLEHEQLERLANADNVRKVSRRDLPIVTAQKGHGATTVAATMWVAAQAGIQVFATGGIGGVHRTGSRKPDTGSWKPETEDLQLESSIQFPASSFQKTSASCTAAPSGPA